MSETTLSLAVLRRIALAVVLGLAAGGAAAQDAGQELSESTLYDLLMGEIALQRGDALLAAKTYLEVARSTRDPRVARRAIEVANFARQPDLALEAAKIWSDAEPTSPQPLQVIAAILISAKRVDEAEPYLEKLLAADGVNLESGYLQLNRLLSGNPDKASNLRVVRKLAAAHPELAQAHFAIAQAALIAGDDAAALDEIRQAQAIRPEWEVAAIFEAQVLLKSSPAEAAKMLGAFVDKHPDAREARLNYARALVLDKRFAEAREQFETVLAANPGNGDVVYAVGLLAFQLKDYAVAESSMKRLLGMGYRDPDGVRYLLGQIAEEQKQWPQAIEWYGQIGEGEHALPARMRAASVMAKEGKLDEGRALLQRVASEHPEQAPQIVVAEAQLLREANRVRDAYDVLGQALKKDPDQPDLLYDYALTAEKLQRYDVLEQNLRRLMEVRPDHAHAYNALGYSLVERNTRLPEAKKLIEHALELAPDDYFIVDSMGWLLYREGDLKGAVAQLRRAYGGRPDPEIGAHLGEVLWMLGQRDEARRVWQESLKATPDNETLLKTIERFK